MNNPVRLAIAAAAVLVVALIGIRFLPSSTGSGGPPTATPTPTAVPTATLAAPAPTATAAVTPRPVPQTADPSLPLIARGSFTSHGGLIELDSSGDGANVTGSMTYTDDGGPGLGGFMVDLACTRTSAAGLIIIGGPIIESTQGYVESAPVGTNIGVLLQRGSPVEALFWIEHPDPHEPDCPTFLESIPDLDDPELDRALEPIEGTVELRP
jgi:hypothetical protein